MGSSPQMSGRIRRNMASLTDRIISGIGIAIVLSVILKVMVWLIGFENTVIISIAIMAVLVLDSGR